MDYGTLGITGDSDQRLNSSKSEYIVNNVHNQFIALLVNLKRDLAVSLDILCRALKTYQLIRKLPEKYPAPLIYGPSIRQVSL